MLKILPKLSILLLSILIVLSGCGGADETALPEDNTEQSTTETTSQEKEEIFQIRTNGVFRSNNLVSVPLVIINETDATYQFSTKKLFLAVDDDLYPIYAEGNRPSDFKTVINQNSTWYNTFTFECSGVSDKKLKSAKLVYAAEEDGDDFKIKNNDKIVVSKPAQKNYVEKNYSNFSSREEATDWAEYYESILTIVNNPEYKEEDLKYLNDSNEDKEFMNIKTILMTNIRGSYDKKLVAVYINNPSNSNLELKMGQLRFNSASGRDYDVEPDHIHDGLYIPARKWALALVPLEEELEYSKGPYSVILKKDVVSENQVMSTKNLPEQMVITYMNGLDKKDFFTVNPGNVQGQGQKEELEITKSNEGIVLKITNKSIFTITCDPIYFTLSEKGGDRAKDLRSESKEKNFEVNSGQTKEIVIPFKDYNTLKDKPNLALRYDGKEIGLVK